MCNNKQPHYRDMREYLIGDHLSSFRTRNSIIYKLMAKGLEPTMDRILNCKVWDEPTESDMVFQQHLIDSYNKRNNKNEEDNND